MRIEPGPLGLGALAARPAAGPCSLLPFTAPPLQLLLGNLRRSLLLLNLLYQLFQTIIGLPRTDLLYFPGELLVLLLPLVDEPLQLINTLRSESPVDQCPRCVCLAAFTSFAFW